MREYKHIRSAERHRQMNMVTFNPGRLLDEVSRRLKVRSDNQLAGTLGIDPAVISKMRSKKEYVTPTVAIAVMDATGMTLNQVRAYAGVPK